MAARHRLGPVLSLGLLAGTVFGAGEALVVARSNAFVQPGQYGFAYLAFPVLGNMALYAALAAGCSLLLSVARGYRDGSASLQVIAAALAGMGVLSVVAPLVADTITQWRELGAPCGPLQLLMLAAIAAMLPLAAAFVTGAAVARLGDQILLPLRRATVVTGLLALLLLWPVARFAATDLSWPAIHPAQRAAAPDAPHVVLITIDTLRADHLGSYGSAAGLTPNLDRLAAAGVQFEDMISASSWTLPAVASLLTGQDPRHHQAGLVTNRRDPLGRSPLPDGAWTLATALQTAGYGTYAVVTNPYLTRHYGLDRGFDTYENLTVESEFFLAGQTVTPLRLLTWLWPDLVLGDRGADVSARAARVLAHIDTTRPFFLWVHYIDPHAPYSRRGSSRHKSFRGDSLLAPGPSGAAPVVDALSPAPARLRSGEIRLSAEDKAAVRALYGDEVRAVDAAVGVVLDALDAAGLTRDTLIVCLSDHGEEFWEHGGVEHGHTLYDELLRVPLILRWPERLPERRHVPGVVRTVDVAPTVLDLLGIASPPVLDGVSLRPVVDGTASPPGSALSENLLFAEERVSLRTDDTKYVRWEDGREELFDLRADPSEQHDLAAIPGRVAAARTALAEVDRRRAPAFLTSGGAPPSDLGRAAGLRALGYLR